MSARMFCAVLAWGVLLDVLEKSDPGIVHHFINPHS